MIESECFAHGYVLSTSAEGFHEVTAGWRTLDVAGATYRFHHRTAYHHRGEPSPPGRPGAPALHVVLIGHAIDLEHDTSDGDVIAGHVLSLVRAGDEQAVIRYVAYLGGRFSCFVHRGGSLEIIPDCHATQSVYWCGESSGLVVSSHGELVGGGTRSDVDEHALGLYRQLVEIRKTVGTKYFPGIVTQYSGVRPVMPNCLLRVDLESGKAEHRRFYPFEELGRQDVDTAYSRFEGLFRSHVRLLSSLGRTGISVTAGLDSRVTLAAVREHLPPGSFAFTFYRAGDSAEAHVNDMYEGNRVAWEYGLPHRIVRWNGPADTTEFDQIFATTFPRLGQARKIAAAFYGQLPRDFFQLQSTIAETGTGFYRHRDVTEISGRRLAHLWHGAEVAEVSGFVEAFDDFMDFSDFRKDLLHDLDYHDAFYWEHRNARWAANRYHEADLAHRVVLPFNQRGLIEAMLSIPLEQRVGKVLLHRLVERFPPPE